MNTPLFYTIDGLEQFVISFFSAYHPILELSSEGLHKNLRPKGERICRFCGAGPNEALFQNVAHLIPELLGNHDLLSDFECDKCNKHFGKYDSDLAASLGMLRTFFGSKGKLKVPTFTSPAEIVSAKPENFYGCKASKISRKNVSDKSFVLNKETGLIQITYTKNSYRPLNVYKSLLKIAISMLPDETVPEYQSMISYLMKKKGDELNPGSAMIKLQFLPFQCRAESPNCVLFKKNDPGADLASHVFSLNYEHINFQFPLPFNMSDLAKGFKNPKVRFCPPLFSERPQQIGVFHEDYKDFSSKDLLKNEIGNISFQVDPLSFNNLKSFDPKTGIISDAELKPEDTAGFYFFDEDNPPNLPF